ncbi:hypothetical protein CC99x_006560 [Candidatus Berkiella cookevillensis]|uniref:Uncharacterized protein n=1 Tax=Candidatus Berkiella cookevillensis TaxID=437022 RepID=A0A0Q9YR07_9GAMM|nr:hypothetical protein [Candidatus Berkiella cookevillensis]MCS5708569.1 hypothetical protein [Candidatus Berkiella cookevillensis]
MPDTIQNYVDKSWNEFSKTYDFEKKFGIEALRHKLSQENRSRGLQGVTRDEVLNLIGSHNNELNNDLSSRLELAYHARQANMTPRAKQRPEQVNENIVDRDLSGPSQKKLPPWPGADKIDFASNPAIRQAVDNFANVINHSNDRQEVTAAYDQLKAELKNQLKAEYKNRLTAKLTPTAPAPKKELR